MKKNVRKLYYFLRVRTYLYKKRGEIHVSQGLYERGFLFENELRFKIVRTVDGADVSCGRLDDALWYGFCA